MQRSALPHSVIDKLDTVTQTEISMETTNISSVRKYNHVLPHLVQPLRMAHLSLRIANLPLPQHNHVTHTSKPKRASMDRLVSIQITSMVVVPCNRLHVQRLDELRLHMAPMS